GTPPCKPHALTACQCLRSPRSWACTGRSCTASSAAPRYDKTPLAIPWTVRGVVVPSVGAVGVHAGFQRLATTSGRRPRSSSHRNGLEHGHERGTTSNRQDSHGIHVEKPEQVSAQCCECALCRRSDRTLSRRLPKLASPNTHSSRSFLSIGRRSCK